jgi:hypothetical protein
MPRLARCSGCLHFAFAQYSRRISATFIRKVDGSRDRNHIALAKVRLRHESAPLLKEREQYLDHLLQQGYSRVSIRNTAAYLVHVVRVMNMKSMRIIPPREIEAAGQSWAARCLVPTSNHRRCGLANARNESVHRVHVPKS